VRNSPGDSDAEFDALTASLPSELLSHRAKVVKVPDVPGLVNAAPDAVQVLVPTGFEVVVHERNPDAGGVNGGETEKPPPVAWVLPVQVADALALPPAASGAEELRVDAGDLPFFARAGDAIASESNPTSPATAISLTRRPKRALSLPGMAAILSPVQHPFSSGITGIVFPSR
jgi:hypothetical protein